jgi:hypothetical protein
LNWSADCVCLKHICNSRCKRGEKEEKEGKIEGRENFCLKFPTRYLDNFVNENKINLNLTI